jgi:hypothetical protein
MFGPRSESEVLMFAIEGFRGSVQHAIQSAIHMAGSSRSELWTGLLLRSMRMARQLRLRKIDGGIQIQVIDRAAGSVLIVKRVGDPDEGMWDRSRAAAIALVPTLQEAVRQGG